MRGMAHIFSVFQLESAAGEQKAWTQKLQSSHSWMLLEAVRAHRDLQQLWNLLDFFLDCIGKGEIQNSSWLLAWVTSPRRNAVRWLRSHASWDGSTTVCLLQKAPGYFAASTLPQPHLGNHILLTLLIHFSTFLWGVPPLLFPLRLFYHAEFGFLLAAPYLLLELTPALLLGVCKAHLSHI